MKREFLQNLKVGEASLPKEVIDAIMAENGRDIENAKQAGNTWEEKYNQALKAHRQELDTMRFQAALEEALRGLAEATDQLARLYGLWERPALLSLHFGDGVLTDPEADRAAEREDVSCGILSAEEFKSRWYGSSMKGERHEA